MNPCRRCGQFIYGGDYCCNCGPEPHPWFKRSVWFDIAAASDLQFRSVRGAVQTREPNGALVHANRASGLLVTRTNELKGSYV